MVARQAGIKANYSHLFWTSVKALFTVLGSNETFWGFLTIMETFCYSHLAIKCTICHFFNPQFGILLMKAMSTESWVTIHHRAFPPKGENSIFGNSADNITSSSVDSSSINDVANIFLYFTAKWKGWGMNSKYTFKCPIKSNWHNLYIANGLVGAWQESWVCGWNNVQIIGSTWFLAKSGIKLLVLVL